ncbi:LamG domain-containing protein [Delftia tsuruhatensis]|uniref:LamG domain-containing protein n=1 Tax=Delftia tsuruhatensis TaxID=180282 RepID=UPI002029845C|nr:LamG-like jellyroll fold domain-containing protein [Delftia tsuruhatensis]
MAAHRYWRAWGMEPYDNGAVIELTEFQLLAGTTRVDASATLTASNGANVAALSDGSAVSSVSLPRGVTLIWDFGASPQDVTDIRLGSSANPLRFSLMATLQWSDDGALWTTACSYWGIAWPGPRALTASAMGFPRTPTNEAVQLLIDFEADTSVPRNLAFGGAQPVQYGGSSAARSTAQARFGAASWFAGNDTSRIQVDGFSYGGGDFTLQAWAYFTGPTATTWSHLLQLGSDLNNRANIGVYNGKYVLYATNGSATLNPGTGRAVQPNTWVHLALVRAGSIYTMFVDGEAAFTGSSSAGPAAFASGSIALGMQQFNGVSSDRWLGWIDDVCFSPRAEYTGPFAVPSLPLSAQASTILLNRVAGRTLSSGFVVASPDGAMPPTGKTHLGLVGKSRTNYLFDRAANGRIRGTVERDASPADVPLRRRVTLLRDIDLMVVQQQWSDAATGTYDFQYIETDHAYTVIAHDYEHNYRAVIADNLSLASGGMELMP